MTDTEQTYHDFVQSRKLSPRRIAANTALQENAVLDLYHGAMILAKESGELLDPMNRIFFYGNDLDEHFGNVLEELSDISFGLSVAFAAVGELLDLTPEEVEAHVRSLNKAKLTQRYSEGTFSEHAARARRDKA